MKANFITDFSTELESSYGLMALNTKGNLLIIESLGREYILGQMEVYMKGK